MTEVSDLYQNYRKDCSIRPLPEIQKGLQYQTFTRNTERTEVSDFYHNYRKD